MLEGTIQIATLVRIALCLFAAFEVYMFCRLLDRCTTRRDYSFGVFYFVNLMMWGVVLFCFMFFS